MLMRCGEVTPEHEADGKCVIRATHQDGVTVVQRTSRRICALGGFQLRTLHTASASDQLLEQLLGVLQVGGVEALAEPVVDVGERRARLIAAVGVAQ
jgi:hypothetical protein